MESLYRTAGVLCERLSTALGWGLEFWTNLKPKFWGCISSLLAADLPKPPAEPQCPIGHFFILCNSLQRSFHRGSVRGVAKMIIPVRCFSCGKVIDSHRPSLQLHTKFGYRSLAISGNATSRCAPKKWPKGMIKVSVSPIISCLSLVSSLQSYELTSLEQ